jgi:Cytochrome c7 and related cytochrome c
VRVKLSWLIGGLAAAAVAAAAVMIFMYVLPLDLRDRSPVQPIAFSHKIHAGDNAIPCLFCHRAAPRSPVAGIPAVADCRACHLFIAQNSPEVGKLMTYWDRKKPVPWVRVYWVPDFVYFPHMMHVGNGVACGECHGDVAAMTRVTRSRKIEMGWCLGCHKQHGASIDCWTCHK